MYVFLKCRHAVTRNPVLYFCSFLLLIWLLKTDRKSIFPLHLEAAILWKRNCSSLLCCHGVRLWRTTWNARTPSPCGERICKIIQTDGPPNSGTFQSLLWTQRRVHTFPQERCTALVFKGARLLAFLFSCFPPNHLWFKNQKTFWTILLLLDFFLLCMNKNRTMKIVF